MENRDPLGFTSQPVEKKPVPGTYTALEKNEGQPSGKGMGWITFLRVLAWLQCAVIIIIGFVVGAGVADVGDNPLPFFAIGFLAGPLVAFSSVAILMVLLDAAENLIHIRRNSQRIAEALSEKAPQNNQP